MIKKERKREKTTGNYSAVKNVCEAWVASV
jgi:hypothetical protein